MVLVEYLEVQAAGPYIDTGVINSSNSYFKLDGQYTQNPGNNYGLFGAMGSGNEFVINAYGGVAYMNMGAGRAVFTETATARHTFEATASQMLIDEVVGGSVDWSRCTNLAYYLFAFHYANSPGIFKTANARIYACQIYNGATLVRDFKPALDENNVACMYDAVTEQYFYNAGTGDFIAGDPITPPLGTYTISFNAAGGTGTMADLTATETQPIALTACAYTRDGYTFSGWATIPGGPVVYEDQETVTDIAAVGETITLYAVWAAMPFSIVLQYNKSEPIALTKDVETIATLHGVLREDSSIIDPVILIEGDLALFAQANYMTIQRFHRKYFIVDMVSVRSHFVEITAHCDVLSSFAGAIRSNKGIVHRQEKDWNLMLNDGALQVYQDPLIDTIAFPGSFSGQSYVMLIGGNRGGGIVMGSGDGNISGKTTSGLVAYAQSRLGTPYWYGCYGQTASASLYNTMATLYPLQYTASDFPDQYGQHVQDCVGLVKGYRWSSDPTAEPVYNASEDVNVAGMYSSCNERHTIASATPIIGSVLFNLTLTHCGVYVGNGKVIEARGHAYGVVQTDISDAGRTWTWWGIPSWLTVSTVAG